MLSNLGASPVNKIHTMLSMFVPDNLAFDVGLDELEAWLNNLVADRKLVSRGTDYATS